MKNAMLCAAFAAALWTPITAASQAPEARAPKSDEPRTITGCVAAGTDARTFTITESLNPASPTPNPSVATAPASLGTWSLKADSNIDLSKYVGKKVEITGSSDRKGGMSADTSASTTRSDASTTGPRFHAKSVKVLAETCS